MTHDRARRHPIIRPDYLQIYRLKAEEKPEEEARAGSADGGAPQPRRTRSTRAFLIAMIAAVAVNTGALAGLVGWGVLQAFGLVAEPAVETVQRAHGASIAQLDASVQALSASVTGLSAHVNAAGDRDEAANRRLAEFNERIGVLRANVNEMRVQVGPAGEEPWRQPLAELTGSVGKLRGDVTGLRASIDEAKPRPANGSVTARLDRIEQAMARHNLLGPMRGAIEPEARPTPAAEAPAAGNGHIISLTPAAN